jgi:hypothetical protein
MSGPTTPPPGATSSRASYAAYIFARSGGFVGPVERRQDSDVDQAALSKVDDGTCPDRAPAVLGYERPFGPANFARRFERTRYVLTPEYFGANGQRFPWGPVLFTRAQRYVHAPTD